MVTAFLQGCRLVAFPSPAIKRNEKILFSCCYLIWYLNVKAYCSALPVDFLQDNPCLLPAIKHNISQYHWFMSYITYLLLCIAVKCHLYLSKNKNRSTHAHSTTLKGANINRHILIPFEWIYLGVMLSRHSPPFLQDSLPKGFRTLHFIQRDIMCQNNLYVLQ